MFNIVILIPVYQHGYALKNTVRRIALYKVPIIVVNDGGDSLQTSLIREVCQAEKCILFERAKNGGKGAAVMEGLRQAKGLGYSHAFQIDADGQHNIARFLQFVDCAKRNPDAVVLGYARYDQSAPLARRVGRWLTHIWVYINSLSLMVRDSMCGFRIYPVTLALKIINAAAIGQRMEFDSEFCVRACWEKVKIINLPVEVSYPQGGVSNFRIKQDNILISMMHARMFFGMLLRLPILARRLSRRMLGEKSDK